MDFETLNEFYRKNPPSIVLDDLGVRHVKEIPLPAEYELSPCTCGITHSIDSDSWYHESMKITEDRIGVYRACKECREILIRKLTTTKMSHWINVKERLPERRTRVLLYCKSEDGDESDCSSSFFCHTGYLGHFGDYFTESLPNCGCTGLSGEITHWMPLPNPPAIPTDK